MVGTAYIIRSIHENNTENNNIIQGNRTQLYDEFKGLSIPPRIGATRCFCEKNNQFKDKFSTFWNPFEAW